MDGTITRGVEMSTELNKRLLKNKKVIEEIHRHQWIQSEKEGRDVGFEVAAADWLENFSKAWMQYHMPKQVEDSKK